MNMNKIRSMAKKLDINPEAMNRTDLIRAIQQKEGNVPCFRTDPPSCTQGDCCWRNECRPGAMIAMS